VLKLSIFTRFLRLFLQYMCRKYFFILGFLSINSAQGQLRHMCDTIRHDVKKERTLALGLDSKNSFIRDLNLTMYGMQVGYLYNRRTNVHLGLYTTFNRKKTVFDNPTAGQDRIDANTVMNKFGMTYMNLEGEYYFYNTCKWRFSIPTGLGIGIGWDKYYKNNTFTHRTTSLVIPIELGFNATYKASWWVWIGAGLGTRLSLASQKYNGPFFTYGLQFQTEEILRRAKKVFKY
jgi:hypothetical protein